MTLLVFFVFRRRRLELRLQDGGLYTVDMWYIPALALGPSPLSAFSYLRFLSLGARSAALAPWSCSRARTWTSPAVDNAWDNLQYLTVLVHTNMPCRQGAVYLIPLRTHNALLRHSASTCRRSVWSIPSVDNDLMDSWWNRPFKSDSVYDIINAVTNYKTTRANPCVILEREKQPGFKQQPIKRAPYSTVPLGFSSWDRTCASPCRQWSPPAPVSLFCVPALQQWDQNTTTPQRHNANRRMDEISCLKTRPTPFGTLIVDIKVQH